MKYLSVLALMSLLVLPLEPPAGHAAVKPWDVSDLTRFSTLVVRGRVASAQSHWSVNPLGEMIVTDWRVDVTEVIDGAVRGRESITVQTIGGRVGDIVMRTGEDAKIAVGEDVVMFLDPHPHAEGAYWIPGWFQGKFTVLDDRVREATDRTYVDFRAEILGHVEFLAQRDEVRGAQLR